MGSCATSVNRRSRRARDSPGGGSGRNPTETKEKETIAAEESRRDHSAVSSTSGKRTRSRTERKRKVLGTADEIQDRATSLVRNSIRKQSQRSSRGKPYAQRIGSESSAVQCPFVRKRKQGQSIIVPSFGQVPLLFFLRVALPSHPSHTGVGSYEPRGYQAAFWKTRWGRNRGTWSPCDSKRANRKPGRPGWMEGEHPWTVRRGTHVRSRGNDRSTDGRSVRLSEPVSTKDGDGLEEPLDRWECTFDGGAPQPIDRQASTKNLDCPTWPPNPTHNLPSSPTPIRRKPQTVQEVHTHPTQPWLLVPSIGVEPRLFPSFDELVS